MFTPTNSYSTQFNSRSLRQNQHHLLSTNKTNVNHMNSHPYIIAQQNNMNTIPNNKSSSPSNIRHRKRKYIETFDDNNILYSQIESQYEPQKKQHITEEKVFKSHKLLRDSYVQNNDVTRNLNALSLNKKDIKNKRKRTFNQINENNNVNDLCDGINKKMKIWDPINNKSYPLNINNNNNNNNEIKEEHKEDIFESELIPKIIQYANLLNNKNIFINKLYNNSVSSNNLINKMRLNKYTGAVVVYKKPQNETWKQLIQEYYENKNDENDDCDMNDNSNKKRPIRLHPSYTGFNTNGNINKEEMKKIANKCYVLSVKENKNNKQKNDDNYMDCD